MTNRATVQQRHTRRPARFEIIEQIRYAVDSFKMEAGAMAICWPQPTNNEPTTCPLIGSLARRNRIGASSLWYAFPQKNKGDLDLPSYRQTPGRPALDRKSVVWGKSVYVRVDPGGRRV